jgi:fructokinase
MTSKYNIGIDLGGTKIEIAILDLNNSILFRKRSLTERQKGPEQVVNNIYNLYLAALEFIGNSSHTLGVGCPGSISKATQLLKNSNITSLNGLPFKDILESKFQKKIILENDANCFALAEALIGAGKSYSSVFGVIMGTGVGGGIVFDRKIINGAQNIAGEWGHSVLDPQGPDCFCGSRGCVGTFISGSGLERRIKEVTGQFISATNFFKENLFDQNLINIKKDFYKFFGQAMANLINVLDPEIIVIGGGLSNEKTIYNEGIKEVYARIFTDIPTTKIVKNTLGDSAGVLGAAFLGRDLI